MTQLGIVINLSKKKEEKDKESFDNWFGSLVERTFTEGLVFHPVKNKVILGDERCATCSKIHKDACKDFRSMYEKMYGEKPSGFTICAKEEFGLINSPDSSKTLVNLEMPDVPEK